VLGEIGGPSSIAGPGGRGLVERHADPRFDFVERAPAPLHVAAQGRVRLLHPDDGARRVDAAFATSTAARSANEWPSSGRVRL
jgi:hypothetical protein